MIQVDVDIDTAGRKELQALAKSFGLKANIKSAILREELRGIITARNHEEEQNNATETVKVNNEVYDSYEQSERDEEVEDDNGNETANEQDPRSTERTKENKSIGLTNQAPSTVEKRPIMKTTNDLKLSKENDVSEDAKSDKISLVYKQESPHASIEGKPMIGKLITTNQEDNEGRQFVGIISSCFEADIGAYCHNKKAEDSEDDISLSDEDIKGLIEQCKADERTRDAKMPFKDKRELPTVESDNIVEASSAVDIYRFRSSTKISVMTKSHSISSHSQSKRNENTKFTSKLEQPHRTNNEQKQTIASQNNLSRGKTKVPLWRIHSRDFIRKRGVDKSRDSTSKNKNNDNNANGAKREPLRNRLNIKNDSNASKSNTIKKNPLKSMPMSKRNEEHMKRFVEQQSKGRKNKAEKERLKMYVNTRDPAPDISHLL